MHHDAGESTICMAKTAKTAKQASDFRALLRDLGWLFGMLRNRWVVLTLIVLLVLFGLHNRESICATVAEHLGPSCGTLGTAPASLVDVADREQVTSCFFRAYTNCQAATMEFSQWWVDGQARNTFLVEPTLGLGACGLGMKIDATGNGTVCGTYLACTKVFSCRALSWHSVALSQLSFWGCGDGEEIRSPIPYPED
jgi:hypothetical protein